VGGQITCTGGGQPPGLGRRGRKAPSASAVSSVSVSVIWAVVPPVSVIWTVVSPVSGVCVIWTVVPPISVIPRTVVPRIVVPPISVVTIPVPIGGAGGEDRRYKKNNQDYQQRFSQSRTPLALPPNRGVRCLSPLMVKRWGGGGLFNLGDVSGRGRKMGECTCPPVLDQLDEGIFTGKVVKTSGRYFLPPPSIGRAMTGETPDAVMPLDVIRPQEPFLSKYFPNDTFSSHSKPGRSEI